MAFSPAIQTLCAELLQQVRDQHVPAGTVYTQRKNGNAFLYFKRMVGRQRVDEYIGPATDPAARERADAIRFQQVLTRQRRKIVSALRRAGVPAPVTALARVLDAMSDAGLFAQGVLVGTAAYQCYAPLIGAALPAAAMMTQDADLATASLALAANDGQSSMLDILHRADPSFREIAGLSAKAPPASFHSSDGFRVDLLTPLLRREDSNPMPLKKLAAGATPLHHLKWLIHEPVVAVAVAGPGIRVQLPQPARFAIHKLIVAQKRPAGDRLKRGKDLQQARALIAILREIDPQPLGEALQSAFRQGKEGWKAPIQASLAELELRLP